MGLRGERDKLENARDDELSSGREVPLSAPPDNGLLSDAFFRRVPGV
jgi:hypothetical protein